MAVGRRSILYDERGLTMLEMLVAMAIMAIGIVGVLRAFSASVTTTKAAELYSVAANLAHQAASELERRPELEPGVLSGTFDGEPGYTWEAEVRSPDASGLQRVEILVSWKVGTRSRDFELVTYLRPGGGGAESPSPVGPEPGPEPVP